MNYKFLLKICLNSLLKLLSDINKYFDIEAQYYHKNAILKGEDYKNFYYYLE